MTVHHPYPQDPASAIPTLAQEIAARIAREGPLVFPAFMEMALYDPTRGYYARETRQVGRHGDFYTSVSVGAVFGTLLAQRFLNWWEASARPEKWRILETGAHDGTLAADVLKALSELSGEAFAGLEYATLEPLPSLAAAQQATLAPFGSTARVLSAPEFSEPLPGIAFGNELLDALPFHVLEWRSGQWFECRVDCGPEGFRWNTDLLWQGDAPTLLHALPEGYRTEVRTGYADLFAPLLAAFTHGLMLWIDYGFPRPDYLVPERTAGTLRTFSNHRAGEDPLESPGDLDITAHVDFTAAAEAGLTLGAIPTEFSDQGSWLTRLAAPWMRQQEMAPNAALIRQFQTLTHPAHLGARFHVLELTYNEPTDGQAITRTARRLALEDHV